MPRFNGDTFISSSIETHWKKLSNKLWINWKWSQHSLKHRKFNNLPGSVKVGTVRKHTAKTIVFNSTKNHGSYKEFQKRFADRRIYCKVKKIWILDIKEWIFIIPLIVPDLITYFQRVLTYDQTSDDEKHLFWKWQIYSYS